MRVVVAPDSFKGSLAADDFRPRAGAGLLLPDGTAVLELAQSSGLPLMRTPDPLGAHPYGLGAVARAALDAGASLGSLLDQVRRSALRVGIVAGQVTRPVPASVSAAVSLVDVAGSVAAALDDPTTWLVEAGGIMAQRLAGD
jgi:hypothetical protein